MIRRTVRAVFSRENLSRDLRTAAVALVVSAVVVATPSVAERITNADKVDGRDAVGASASVAQRSGKLVATDGRGRLPDNIIRRAPDADRLDGLDSTALVPRRAKPRSVQTGYYSAWGAGPVGDSVALPSLLSARIAENRVTFLARGASPTAQCPGPGKVVPAGWGCFYETSQGGAVLGAVFDPAGDSGPLGVGRAGFGIFFECSSSGPCWSHGTWAIKAP